MEVKQHPAEKAESDPYDFGMAPHGTAESFPAGWAVKCDKVTGVIVGAVGEFFAIIPADEIRGDWRVQLFHPSELAKDPECMLTESLEGINPELRCASWEQLYETDRSTFRALSDMHRKLVEQADSEGCQRLFEAMSRTMFEAGVSFGRSKMMGAL